MSSSNHGLSESQFTTLRHEAVNAKAKAYCKFNCFLDDTFLPYEVFPSLSSP